MLSAFEFASNITWSVQVLAEKVHWAITRCMTASISIQRGEKVNKDVTKWIGENVIARQSPRVLAAQTSYVVKDEFSYWHNLKNKTAGVDRKPPLSYVPTSKSLWFVHDRNLFFVRRVPGKNSKDDSKQADEPMEYAEAPTGSEALVITVLGRSVEPIKRFINTCRASAGRIKIHMSRCTLAKLAETIYTGKRTPSK